FTLRSATGDGSIVLTVMPSNQPGARTRTALRRRLAASTVKRDSYRRPLRTRSGACRRSVALDAVTLESCGFCPKTFSSARIVTSGARAKSPRRIPSSPARPSSWRSRDRTIASGASGMETSVVAIGPIVRAVGDVRPGIVGFAVVRSVRRLVALLGCVLVVRAGSALVHVLVVVAVARAVRLFSA